MSVEVFAAVLFSALCHASWNTLVKGWTEDRLAAALMFGWVAVIAFPFLFVVSPPRPEAWPYLAAAMAVHTLYKVTLLNAYSLADMSVVYPIARGGAPLLVTLAAAVFFGEVPGARTLAAIAVVAVAVISLGLAERKRNTESSGHGALAAVLTASLIAGYTVIDGAGARVAGSAASFVVWLFVLDGSILPLWCILRIPSRFLRAANKGWRSSLAGAVVAFVGFFAVIWAMTKAPMGPVAALRETSVLFATVLAAVVLKERLSRVRVVSILAIAFGLVLMKT